MWGALNEGNKSTSPISPAFHLLAGGTKENGPKKRTAELTYSFDFYRLSLSRSISPTAVRVGASRVPFIATALLETIKGQFFFAMLSQVCGAHPRAHP